MICSTTRALRSRMSSGRQWCFLVISLVIWSPDHCLARIAYLSAKLMFPSWALRLEHARGE